jgi:hypothetical protein
MVLLILRLIGLSFLLAVLLIVAAAFLDFGLRSLMASTQVWTSHWPIVAWLYGRLKMLHFNGEAASALLGTLAGIAGVFLALYFTVVGTLVGGRYANVPPNVRELMISEKLGNQYIRLVALFGAVATLLLAAQSLGISFGLLNLAVVTILGTATILSFVTLGRRAFEFFDPGSLVNALGFDMASWINRATKLRYFGRQHSFQAHYQRQVAALLDSYDGVVRMAAEDAIARQHTLPYLAQHTLRILGYYGRRKHFLASESYWFRRQYEHKNWLTTSFTETSIALQTGTALLPKEVPDLLWFEKETTEIFWLAYEKLLDSGNLNQAATVSLAAAEAIGQMGECLLMTEAVRFANCWAPLIRRQAAKTKGDMGVIESRQTELAQRLGIVECYALGAIRLLLSFATAVSGGTSEQLRKSLSEPTWLSGDRIYEVNAPRPVIIALEEMRDLVDFEEQVEGTRRTTSWYLRQRIAYAYGTWYRESLEALLSLFESAFGVDLEALVKDGCWLAAAALGTRALEGCNKFQNHLDALRESHDAWMEWRGHASGEWPSIDWDAIAKRIAAVEERVEISLSALLIPLSGCKKSDMLPDFFGQALGTSTQACFEGIVFDCEQQVMKMFPPLFAASLAAFERLRNELKDFPTQTSVIFSTEPIENLMELSGYAIIYSELGPKNTWATLKTTWDRYFTTVSDPKGVARWLATVMKVRGEQFGINPGDLQRTNWKQHFENDMRHRGWLADRWSRNPWERDREKGHSSPIVRALLRGGDVYSDLSDVFLVVYLLKIAAGDDVPMTAKTDSFADSLERENQRCANDKDNWVE